MLKKVLRRLAVNTSQITAVSFVEDKNTFLFHVKMSMTDGTSTTLMTFRNVDDAEKYFNGLVDAINEEMESEGNA